MNGQAEMDSQQLYDLLASTQIEDFDAVKEAFNLLDVKGEGYLKVETFKDIFRNLKLGEIAPSDEDIFNEVADFDKDGQISLEDFRKILTYKPGEDQDNMIEGTEPVEDDQAEMDNNDESGSDMN